MIVSLSSLAVLITVLCVVLAGKLDELIEVQPVWVTVCVVLALLCAICVVIIWRQPESQEALTFKVSFWILQCLFTAYNQFIIQLLRSKTTNFPSPHTHTQVPLLPWLPLFSVFVNIYLMMQLDLATWCRFAVWMAIGELT